MIKYVATDKNSILRQKGLKFQNLNILCKIAFWNKRRWLNDEEGWPGKRGNS